MSTNDSAPAKKPAAGKTPAKRAQPKSARRRSREAALQGLYQWLITGDD
ncbi:MAG: N utilization substance protein B, partial [Burkholderiaceae bacterium]|nr:N utilization substance protein B [Burkholderiaceae bacterium]